MSKKKRIRKEKSLARQTLRSQYERLYMPTQFTKDKIAFPPERVLDESMTVEVPLELPAGCYEAKYQSRSRAGGKTDLSLSYLINKAAHEFADAVIVDAYKAMPRHVKLMFFEDDSNFVRTGGPDARHMTIDVQPVIETTEPKQLTGDVSGFIKTIKEEKDGKS